MPTRAAAEAMLTIAPPKRRFRIRSIASPQQRNMPVRCVSMTRCHSAGVIFSASPIRCTPALLTSTSTCPAAASTAEKAALTLDGSATSASM